MQDYTRGKTADKAKAMVWIPVLMICLAILACYGNVNMNTISPLPSVGCEPVTFVLRGEAGHLWDATLLPETKYQITVKTEDELHPIIYIGLSASIDRTLINDEVITSMDEGTATTTFIAPQDGKVTISVYSHVGEDYKNLGEHSIAVCEIEE